CNQPTSAGSQNFGERIIDFVFLSERDDAILVHGVTLLLGDSGGLVTNPVTPPSSPRHPVSSIAHKIREETGNILPCSLFVTSVKELRSEDPWASEQGVKKLRVSGVEHGV